MDLGGSSGGRDNERSNRREGDNQNNSAVPVIGDEIAKVTFFLEGQETQETSR
jgi:hypothetical protein